MELLALKKNYLMMKSERDNVNRRNEDLSVEIIKLGNENKQL